VFNKKIELPKLSYFILKVNLAAIQQWLPNQRKIEPTPEKDWKGCDTKEYKITILPTDPFTFYHNQADEFSPSIGGLDIISNEKIGCVEWSWNESYFYLNVSEPRVPIFSVPIDEMFHLLKTGNNLSKQALGDKEFITLGSDELFDEFYRSRSTRYSLAYSNELVSLTLICARSYDLVNY
jgi:hypothetical protein